MSRRHKAIFDTCLCGASFPTAFRAMEHARAAQRVGEQHDPDSPETGWSVRQHEPAPTHTGTPTKGNQP